MASNKFNELDFDVIKDNIKQFLSNKSEFNDHNFEGSTWSLILDALAYSAHYTGVYSNMALSETFLDTAQLRNSVVSRAKELGYVPQQKTSSKAKVQLDLSSTTGQTITVPIGTKFSASIDTLSYTYQTTSTFAFTEDGTTGDYTAVVDIVQGAQSTIEYTITDPSVDRYIVYDTSVDTSTVTVTVNGADYIKETDFVTITPDDKVFFFEETFNEQLEIEFGDGILGFQPTAGDVVRITYLSTAGKEANNVNAFSLVDAIDSNQPNSFVVTTINRSSGGADKDSIERIKFIAPKVYEAQNRLVTANDYTSLLMNNFAGIKTVSVWGGEDNVPTLFGKVFVSIALEGTGGATYGSLTDQLKSEITTFLDTYKIMSIIPELIDPDFILLDIDADVTYDITLTSKTSTQLVDLVKIAIQNYITNNLQVFTGALRLSKLLKAIDDSDPSIVDSLINLKLVKKHIVPSSNIPSSITINFSDNAVVVGSFKSDLFNVDDYYFDDGLGNIDLMNGEVLTKAVGTINYDTSVINIDNVNFAADAIINFRVTPISLNVASKRLNILDEGNITTNLRTLGN